MPVLDRARARGRRFALDANKSSDNLGLLEARAYTGRNERATNEERQKGEFHAVSRLEDERASLQATVDELSSRGGRLDVRTCRLEDGTVDTCIRVGSQGYGSGYHIPVWKK